MLGGAPLMLQAKEVKKYYTARGGLFLRSKRIVRAVDGVSFDIQSGEVMGLVGESGCGKSTLARLLLRLEQPTQGSVSYEHGHDTLTFRRAVQGVFQDPFGTLDPRYTVGASLEEGLRNLYKEMKAKERGDKIHKALQAVGLSPDCLARFPHEFSGGQRQRIGIARALVVEPKLLICDEPVSSLDVSVAAQIIALLKKLNAERGLGLVIISHHMGIVSALASRIAVMKAGRIIEMGPAKEVIGSPRESYTRQLMAAIPRLRFGLA